MGGELAVVAAGLAILVYSVLAVAAMRHRLLARVAGREAFRRPVQSAVVLAGLTIGTAAILGPQVFVDSLFDSLASAGDRSWGRIDITVSAGGASFSPNVAESIAARSAGSGAVAGVQAGVDLMVSAADQGSRLNAVAVRFVGFDPGSQRPFGAFLLEDRTRTYGDDLPVGSVLVSQSLADGLLAHVGDPVRVSVGGRADDVVVAGIVTPEGPGAFGLRPAMFAPLATAARLIGSDGINVVRITAAGDGRAEADAAAAAIPGIRSLVAGMGGIPKLDVRNVKAAEAVAFARNQEGGRFLTLGFGLFVIAVGIALVVNLALSLAEERRPRLALLRAIGLSRAGLVTISMLEGALYSIGAAVLGVLAGALYAALLFTHADNAMIDSVNGRDIPMQLSLRPDTIVGAMALGALVTLLTVFMAAIRSSRMTIVSAIRDLPEPERVGGRSLLREAVLLALGAAGILAVVVGDVALRFVGGWALIASATGLTRGQLPDRPRAMVAGVLLMAWSIVLLASQPPDSNEVQVDIQYFILAAITTVFGLSLVAAANLRILEGLPGLLGNRAGRLRGTMRPPLAYMTRRPVRAGLTLAALGLVVALITTVTLINAARSRPDTARDAGGFDIVAASAGSWAANPPASLDGQIARTVSIPTRVYVGPDRMSLGTDWHDQSVVLYELSDAEITHPLARLAQRHPRFASDDEVWRTIASDPSWVVASSGTAGGMISLIGPHGPVELKVAGSFALGFLDGIAGSRQALAQFADLPAGEMLLIQAKPGVDVASLFLAIRRSLFSEGVNAAMTATLLEQGQVQGRTWGELFRVWSMTGLLAGMLSIGVLTVRAVLERRRAIGVLRALGARPGNVRSGLVMEALLTAAVGIAGGFVAALEITYAFVDVLGRQGVLFQDAWVGDAAASVAITYGVILLVTLGASIGPSLAASRLTPIEALRAVE